MFRLALPRNNRDAGFVLVSVLWILAILTVIALGFARRAMLERRMAWYALDREQAQHMARAAAERGLFAVRHNADIIQFDSQWGYIGLDQRWAREIDLFAEGYFFDVDPDEFADDVCTVRIEDDEGRIGLNVAPRELLASLKPLSFKTIDTILDRRQVSTPGYQPALFLTVDALRELQPFTEEQWLGSKDQPGLSEVLSVDGDRGVGNLNLNTAPEAVLASLPNVDERVLEAIMEYRNGPDGIPYTLDDQAFQSTMELGQKLDVSAEKLSPITAYCKTTSRHFRITGHASRRGGKVNAYCTLFVNVQGSRAYVLAWKEDTHGA